ncbi:TPA: hypothetical protein ACNVU4_001270 [Morganella morganii]
MYNTNNDIENNKESMKSLVNRAMSLNSSIEKNNNKIIKLNFAIRIAYVLILFTLMLGLLFILPDYIQGNLYLSFNIDTLRALLPSITIISAIISIITFTINFIYQNKKTLLLKNDIYIMELNDLFIYIDEYKSYLKAIYSENPKGNKELYQLLYIINETEHRLKYIRFSHKMG